MRRNSPSAVIPLTGSRICTNFSDALAWLDAAHEAATEATEAGKTGAKATDGKEGRDAAYIELKEFMKEIKGVARAAFRKDADKLAQLGLTK